MNWLSYLIYDSGGLKNYKSQQHQQTALFADAYLEFCKTHGQPPVELTQSLLVKMFVDYPNFITNGKKDSDKIAMALLFVNQVMKKALEIDIFGI